MSRRPLVFLSYSHRDEAAKDALLRHLDVLVREGILETWDDRRIKAGEYWKGEIEKALDGAKIAVLLVSADFLRSPFVRDTEVPRLLERAQNDGLRIYPIIIQPCVWPAIPWLSAIQARPKDGRPLLGGTAFEQDTAWSEIAMEIYRFAREDEGQVPTAAAGMPAHLVAQDVMSQGGSASDSVLACDEGPYEIEATTFHPVELKVQKGDRVEGSLVETSSQAFDFWILDQRNFTDWVSGEEIEGIGGFDRPAYPVSWRVPHKGPWFLVLDASGKRNDREVEVLLQRSSPQRKQA